MSKSDKIIKEKLALLDDAIETLAEFFCDHSTCENAARVFKKKHIITRAHKLGLLAEKTLRKPLVRQHLDEGN